MKATLLVEHYPVMIFCHIFYAHSEHKCTGNVMQLKTLLLHHTQFPAKALSTGLTLL